MKLSHVYYMIGTTYKIRNGSVKCVNWNDTAQPPYAQDWPRLNGRMNQQPGLVSSIHWKIGIGCRGLHWAVRLYTAYHMQKDFIM